MSTITALLTELRHAIDPQRVVTGGLDYDAAVALWNGAVTARPAVVVRCATAADAQVTVRAARTAGLPLSVRGRGYGWSGRALREGGVVIDVSGMRDVRVDASLATARVAGGASFADVAAATEPFMLAPVTGMVGTVGAVGTSLGGGYGPLSGRFGLASDNIIAAEVVLADGSIVTADAEHERDLFWALRGGGGNFGVVTSLTIRLHRVPTLLVGLAMYPWTHAATILEELCPLLDEAPDELTVQIGVITSPDGATVLTVNPIWAGPPETGATQVEEITRLATPLMAQVAPMSCAQVLNQFDGQFPDGRHIAMAARTVPSLTPPVVAALEQAGATKTSPLSTILTHSFHGAATRVPLDSTPVGIRSPHQVIEIVATWEGEDSGGERHRSWAADVSAALAPESLPGGYVNLLGPDADDQIPYVYGPNTTRLLAIKAAIDPDAIFDATPMPSNLS